MTTILLIILIILTIINIIISVFKKKTPIDIKPQLKELETSIIRFDTTLDRTEKSVKDEFQRNRTETNETSKNNRDELSKSLTSFETQFSKNVKESDELIRQKFGDFSKQQTENNKLTTENIKTVENTIDRSNIVGWMMGIPAPPTKKLLIYYARHVYFIKF